MLKSIKHLEELLNYFKSPKKQVQVAVVLRSHEGGSQ